MEAQRATLAEMGLRATKAIANHLLQENTHESNLVSDIAYAPYLRGNRGRTHLAPIPGFPPFCDDAYFYGRLQARDVVWVGKRVSCTTGETGSASLVVGRISNLAQEVWPRAEHKYIHVSIANTVGVGAGGKICETIQAIEAGSDGKLEREWRAQHDGADPIAYFVAKLDVSELPIAVLHAGLRQFQQLLSANCMGLYQLDYTQDFSGTLDRPELVQHLEKVHHFYRQGERPPENPQGCILDNTGSVGDHVCTFVQTIGGRTTSTKLYNKFVAQIEAGDVRGQFGGHMSGVVASTNEHLRQTLAHPDVLARGCTRLEISIHGCAVEELSPTRAANMLEHALQLATPEGEGPDTGLFVVQPLPKLWENYASCLHRCLALADRSRGNIYVAWSGNSKTGRTQGVLVRPTKAKVEDAAAWRKAIDWAIADFALRRCPIVLVEIRAVVDGVVEFAPLQCYMKDAPTILCPSTRPCELHIDGPNLEELLPPTPTLEWRWHTQKAQRIGVALPSCELVEVPAMLEGRHLSTLSTRGRVSRLFEHAEANNPHLAGWPDTALCKGGARAKRAAPARLRVARAGHQASKAGAGKEAKAAPGNRRRRPLHEEGCRPRRQGGLRTGIHGNGEWHKEGSPANGERVGQIRRSPEALPPFLGVAHAGVGSYSRQPSRVFREGGEVSPLGHTVLDPLRPHQEPARPAHSHSAKQILLDGRRAADPLEPARATFHL